MSGSPRFLACFTAVFLLAFLSLPFAQAETIPPPPKRHFNDYAGVVPGRTAALLDQELAQFERDTSSQLLVAVFKRMDSESSVEDYTVRVAESWKVGGRERDNGAVLFVFVEDRQVYIQVGYGLEGAIPDALAATLIRNEITPRFRAGDFAGGLRNGVHGLMAAARGEYTGTGRTAADGRRQTPVNGGRFAPILFFFVTMMLFGALRRGRDRQLSRRGRRSSGWDDDHWPPAGGGFRGFGGGVFRGGGGGFGGGFSGGGGSFGGGGAGGRW